MVNRCINAEKIIGNLYAICKDNHYPNSSVLMEQAEQFLKEKMADEEKQKKWMEILRC